MQCCPKRLIIIAQEAVSAATIPALYKTSPNPARATARRPRATSNPAAPLPESEELVALALEEESVPEPVAKPLWMAVSEVVVAVLVNGTCEVLTATLARVLLVEGYAEAAVQYCSRCCWTVVTPGSEGQLL